MKKVKTYFRNFKIDTSKIDLNDPNSAVEEVGGSIRTIVAEIIDEARTSALPLVDYEVKKPVPTGKPMEYSIEIEVIFSDE